MNGGKVRPSAAEHLCDRVFAITLRRNVCPCLFLSGKLPDPIRIVSAIREQHRLGKRRAEQSRTQPIVVRFAREERETRRHEFLKRFVAISTEADELKSFFARLRARLAAHPSGELARRLEWSDARLLQLDGELTADWMTSVLRERELFPDVDYLLPAKADQD